MRIGIRITWQAGALPGIELDSQGFTPSEVLTFQKSKIIMIIFGLLSRIIALIGSK
jgi:hypothetical protein